MKTYSINFSIEVPDNFDIEHDDILSDPDSYMNFIRLATDAEETDRIIITNLNIIPTT